MNEEKKQSIEQMYAESELVAGGNESENLEEQINKPLKKPWWPVVIFVVIIFLLLILTALVVGFLIFL